MSHVSQIIAVEKGIKAKAAEAGSLIYGHFKTSELFSGISKTYTPIDENSTEWLPGENKQVPLRAREELAKVQARLVDLLNVTATKDWSNCYAKADVTVDDTTLITGAPATYLLFLEKELAEIASFVKEIPLLPSSETWTYDQNQDCYVADPTETMRTRKDKKSNCVFEGNQHHPPQFVVWDEEVPQGRWKTIKYSGAMPAKEVNAIAVRIEKLQQAVKFAREEANRSEALQQSVGAPILTYIFG